ncbi:hypothetical protein TNCV_1304541 [Trichonephila clavipes]|nr:hypothetical protein TNCV_1304541 [Trichonephila clavipes]
MGVEIRLFALPCVGQGDFRLRRLDSLLKIVVSPFIARDSNVTWDPLAWKDFAFALTNYFEEYIALVHCSPIIGFLNAKGHNRATQKRPVGRRLRMTYLRPQCPKLKVPKGSANINSIVEGFEDKFLAPYMASAKVNGKTISVQQPLDQNSVCWALAQEKISFKSREETGNFQLYPIWKRLLLVKGVFLEV